MQTFEGYCDEPDWADYPPTAPSTAPRVPLTEPSGRIAEATYKYSNDGCAFHVDGATRYRVGQCPQCSRWWKASRPAAQTRGRWAVTCSPKCKSQRSTKQAAQRKRVERGDTSTRAWSVWNPDVFRWPEVTAEAFTRELSPDKRQRVKAPPDNSHERRAVPNPGAYKQTRLPDGRYGLRLPDTRPHIDADEWLRRQRKDSTPGFRAGAKQYLDALLDDYDTTEREMCGIRHEDEVPAEMDGAYEVIRTAEPEPVKRATPKVTVRKVAPTGPRPERRSWFREAVTH